MKCTLIICGLLAYSRCIGATLQITVDDIREGSYYSIDTVTNALDDVWNDYLRERPPPMVNRAIKTNLYTVPPWMEILIEPNTRSGVLLTRSQVSFMLNEVDSKIRRSGRQLINSITWSARQDGLAVINGIVVGRPSVHVLDVYPSHSEAALSLRYSVALIQSTINDLNTHYADLQRLPNIYNHGLTLSDGSTLRIIISVKAHEEQPGPRGHDLLVANAKIALRILKNRLDSENASGRKYNEFTFLINQDGRDQADIYAMGDVTVAAGRVDWLRPGTTGLGVTQTTNLSFGAAMASGKNATE